MAKRTHFSKIEKTPTRLFYKQMCPMEIVQTTAPGHHLDIIKVPQWKIG